MNQYLIAETRRNTQLASQRRAFYYGGFYYVFYVRQTGGISEDVYYKASTTVVGLAGAIEQAVFGFDTNMAAWGAADIFFDRASAQVGVMTAGGDGWFRCGDVASGVVSWRTAHRTGIVGTANNPHICRTGNDTWFIGATSALTDLWDILFSTVTMPENVAQWDTYIDARATLADPAAPGASDFVRLAPSGTGNAYVEIFDSGGANGVSVREHPYYPGLPNIASGIDCDAALTEPVTDSNGVVWWVGLETATNILHLFRYTSVAGTLTSTPIYTGIGVVVALSLAINDDDSMFLVGRDGITLIALVYLKGRWEDLGDSLNLGGAGIARDASNGSQEVDGNANPTRGSAPLSVQFSTDVFFLPSGLIVDVSSFFAGSTVGDANMAGHDPFFRNRSGGYELLIAWSEQVFAEWQVYAVQSNIITADWLFL